MGMVKETSKPMRVLWHLRQVQAIQAGCLHIYVAQEALAIEVSTDAQTKIRTLTSIVDAGWPIGYADPVAPWTSTVDAVCLFK